MSRFEALAGLLAGLKGAPASVLWAMELAGRPLSQGELVLLTGYSEKPVRRAVRLLLARGMIERDGPRVLVLAAGWTDMAQETGDWTGAGMGRAIRSDCPVERAVESSPAGVVSGAKHPLDGGGPEKTGQLTATAGGPSIGTAAAGERISTTPVDNAGLAAEEARRPGDSDAGGRFSRSDGQIGDPDVVVAGSDPDLDQDDQQQQQEAAEEGQLAGLLRRMGINGRAFQRLAGRADLAARPEVVLAWWWYYRSQEWVRNPAGAAISRLDAEDEPPGGFLSLAQVWPGMPAGMRQELESLHLHNWSAEQIAATLQPVYPGLTAGAVRAYMALYLAAPEELEAGKG